MPGVTAAGFSSAYTLMVTLAIVAIAVGLALSLAIARSLSTGIGQIVGAATAMARGDLTRQVPVGSGDEVGLLGKTFNKMSGDFRDIISKVAESAGQSAGVEQLAAGSGSLMVSARYLQELVGRFRYNEQQEAMSDFMQALPSTVFANKIIRYVNFFHSLKL